MESRWFLIGVVQGELLLGSWLLSGLFPRAAWWASLAAFAGFAVVAAGKAVGGEASCGCFGRLIQVNPSLTAMLDLAIVVSLLHWRPTQVTDVSRQVLAEAVCVLLIWASVGVPAGLAITSYKPASLTDAGGVLGDDTTVLLKPHTWVGKQFPLSDYIDIAHDLKEGKWLLVLYHHDCPKCQEVISRYSGDAPRTDGQADGASIALVELPPYGEMRNSNLPGVRGRLDEKREWLIDTPSTLVLENGIVTQWISKQ
jgi:hypothetical protein